LLTSEQTAERAQELIFLDPSDDLGTVRAKLESSNADHVVLVVPKSANILRTPLEFRILARLASELSTDLTVVTADRGRRHLARKEGVRVRRGFGAIDRSGSGLGSNLPWAQVLEWLPLPSVASVMVVGLFTLLIGGLALVALPVMRVTIVPVSEGIQRDLELIVDPGQNTPDHVGGLLPGKLMQYRFEITGSLPTTSQKPVGRDPARGEVVFSSASPDQIVVPARSVVVARNGARFLTDSEARVAPFSFGVVRVGVAAEQRGIAGNVDANQVVSLDPPVDRLTVTNQRPMVGGSDRPAKSVAAEDREKLKELLLERAREQAMVEFRSRGGSAESVPSNTLQIKVEAESYQPPVEAEGELLSGTMILSASALAWDNQGLNALVQQMLLARYGGDYDLPMSQLRLQPPEVLGTQSQRLRLKVVAQALAVHTVDAESISEQLRWKSGAEARSVLRAIPGLSGVPRIEMTPAWMPRAYRVEVDVAVPK
jgi:hypothetical protein